MRHTFIPKNATPALYRKQAVRSLASVARERSAALENAAIARHEQTQAVVREREVTLRAVIAAIDAPAQRQHFVKPGRVRAGTWWQQ